MAQQPDVVLLACLHVHHQARVQIAQLGGLGKRLVQIHLPGGSFAARPAGPQAAAGPQHPAPHLAVGPPGIPLLPETPGLI